jgi:teichuronic acid biosynthesis glycosyltransferase TuaG
MPEVSFITSCYNSEQFLDGLIENTLQQTIQDFEHIIVDSASTDGSVEIIKKWREKDSRIKLIEQPKRTPYGFSWLVGWHCAKGRIVTNSNTDDRSFPWRGIQILQAAYEASRRNRMLRQEKSHFYYGGYETRVNDRVIAKGVPPTYSSLDLQQFFRCGVHVHWDNKLRDLVDWRRMFKAGMEYRSAFDYWLVLYFMSLGVSGISIPSCLSIYNQRPDSLEQSDKERSNFEALRAIEEFFPSSPSIIALENDTKFASPDYYKRYKDFLHEFDR